MTILSSLASLVSTLASLKTSLDNLAAKQGNSDCGCGSGNQFPPEPSGLPGDPQTDPPPVGFPDWPAYNVFRCKAAQWTVGHWIAFFDDAGIRDWDVLATGGLSIMLGAIGSLGLEYALASAGAAVLGGWVVVAGVAIAIATFIISDLTLDFQSVSLVLTNSRQQLTCVIYEAETAVIARDGIMELLAGSGLSAPEMYIVGLVVTVFDINRTFDNDGQLSNYVPPADCSGCGSAGVVTVDGYSLTPASPVIASIELTNIAGETVTVTGNRLRVEGTSLASPVRVKVSIPIDALDRGHAAEFVSATYPQYPTYNNGLDWGDAAGRRYLAVDSGQYPVDVRLAGRGTGEVSAGMVEYLDHYQTGSPGSWTFASWEQNVENGHVQVWVEKGGAGTTNGRTFSWEVDLYTLRQVV